MRRRPDDDGFTLLELMVVMLIVAILLAIAVPTFLAARERSNDRATQTQLRNALTVELVIYAGSSQQEFSENPLTLQEVDSSLAYTILPSTMLPGRNIYVDVFQTSRPNDTVVVGAKSRSGKCFWLRQIGDKNQPRFALTDCDASPISVPDASVFQDEWQ